MDSIALNTVRGAGRLLVATDDVPTGPYQVVRAKGFELARAADLAVVLYDRTSESLFVDPYPSGPWTADVQGPDGTELLGMGQVRAMGRSYLASQLREAEEAGVQASAWLPRKTGAKAMLECVERFGVGAVVMSDDVVRPTLRDRVRGNTIEKFSTTIAVPILLVGRSGQITRATPQHAPAI